MTKNNKRRKVPVTKHMKTWFHLVIQIRRRNDFCKSHEKIVTLKNPNRSLSNLAKRAGVKWVKNGLRKGFVSYHAELHGAEATAPISGHSVSTLEQNYKGLVSREDADAWFNIFPNGG